MNINGVPVWWYKHPKTGEMFSDLRTKGFEKKPLVVKGVICELDLDYILPTKKHKPLGPRQMFKDGQREVWEADSHYVKKCNPKYVKYQDGHKERYDPSKHC